MIIWYLCLSVFGGTDKAAKAEDFSYDTISEAPFSEGASDHEIGKMLLPKEKHSTLRFNNSLIKMGYERMKCVTC